MGDQRIERTGATIHGQSNLIDAARRIEKDDRMYTLMSSEKDSQQKTPDNRRKARHADAPRPKSPINELTCNEADVDDLLSTGELT